MSSWLYKNIDLSYRAKLLAGTIKE